MRSPLFMLRSLSLAAVLALAALGLVDAIIALPDLSVTVERGLAKSAENEDVQTFVIKNKKGLTVSISSLGATITHLCVPDRAGKSDDIVLGYDSPAEYQKDTNYFGAIVGRVANRIAKGRFTLDGKQYVLARNDGDKHSLHGGNKGFDKRIWSAKAIRSGVELTLRSADGEEGYPGAVEVRVRYTVKDWTVRVEMRAESEAATPINLAQHSYFNLAGHGSGPILGHEVQLEAHAFTELEDSVCTGALLSAAHTPFDLSAPAVVGERVAGLAAAQGIGLTWDAGRGRLVVPPNMTDMGPRDTGGPLSGTVLGFDHNFVLLPGGWLRGLRGGLRRVGRVREAGSGRTMTVESDAPGVQFYTGNFIHGCRGKGGAAYGQHGGLCLETQHFPNSIGADPATPFGAGACPILRPGRPYRHTVTYTFGTDK